MTRTALRATFIFTGAVATLGVALAACGGGGSGASTSPATVAAPVTAPSMNPNQVNNNFTGPSSQVTVSFKLPAPNGTHATREYFKKIFGGSLLNNPHLRTMGNTSPTASLRALGQQENTYARQVEASTKRTPQFVSGAIVTMEFVLSSGATVLVDDTQGCSGLSCSGTFTVPLGSYTATLYVYDNCPFLIAAGTSPVTVTAGQNSPLTITLNPVAAAFQLTASVPNVIADPSAATTFTVSATALDANFDTLSTPGVLLDSNFFQVTGLTMTQDGTDVTPAGATIPLNGSATFFGSSPAFNFAGTGTEPFINFTGTETNNGTPYLPILYTGPGPQTTMTGNGALADNPVSVQWTNTPMNYPIGGDNNSPSFTNPGPFQLEFPTLAGDGTVTLGLSSNAPNYAGNVTITDNGACAGIITYPTGSTPYQTFALTPFVQLGSSAQGSNETVCALTATVDATGLNSVLRVDYDSSNLTIQNKARAR